MATIRGNTSALIRQFGGSVRFNQDSSATATETFHCLYADAIQKAPKRYTTPHPLFPNLICNEVEIKEINGGLAEITATYFGPATGLTNGGPDLTPTYELSCESSEQPIETFENFATTIGTAGNGAQFDSDGVFKGYAATSAYAGQTSWLVPGVIWRKQGYSMSAPSSSELARVGKIDTPEGWVSTPSGRNWLLRSFAVTQKGQIYTYTKTWELSGPSGWNTTIYAAA